MYMPLMVDLKKVVVFGGERGEGLQKVQKFGIFADEILVVPESKGPSDRILLKKGPQDLLNEDLRLPEERIVPVAPEPASLENVERYAAGATLVSSDLKSRRINEAIKGFCDANGILCNIIDTKDLCNTWLMSLIDTPDLQVALTTKGRCAYYAAKAREILTPQVEELGRWAQILAEIRMLVPPGRSKLSELDAVYHDAEFRRFMNRKDWENARRKGREMVGNDL